MWTTQVRCLGGPTVLVMEIGGYRAQRLLGEGAGSAVWQAVGPDNTPVALKVFGGPYESALQAAKREAALVAQVDHPHLARISALVCDADQVALAIELADGGSLEDLLARRGRLTPAETLTVLIPMASALATAHERGVVHGDLSPANIVFDRGGRPLLTDLGAARVAVECGLPVAATAGYVAPEVARGGFPGPSADVFALAAVGLHCLSGRPAWNADDLRDVVVQATVGQWPDPDDDDGPPALVAAIRSALCGEPERRPGAASLAVDLSRSGTAAPVDLAAESVQPAAAPVTSIGRHRASDEPGPSPRIGAPGSDAHPSSFPGSVAQQRIRRVVTRVRVDSTPAPAAATVPPPRWRRMLAWCRRSGRPAAPNAGTGRPSPFKIAATATVLLLIGALAVQAGLMWAGSGRRGGALPPVVSSPVAPGDRSAAPAPSPGRAASWGAAPSPRPSRTVNPSPSSATSPGSPALRTPAAGPPGPAARGAPGADQQAQQWLFVMRDLDSARAGALVHLDARRLSAVYTDESTARAADAATISGLAARGVRVAGALHRISAVRVIGSPPEDGASGVVRLEVIDLLPSYRVLDRNGATVGSTGGRGQARRMIDVVGTTNGYRISAVSTG